MNRLEKQKREERLFLAAYLLWLIYAVLHITMWGDIDLINTVCQYLKKIGYLLLIIRFLLKRQFKKQDIIGIFLIIFSCALSEHSVYNKQLIPVAIFVCFSGEVRFNKILKYTLALQCMIMAVTILASQTGIIEDVIWYEGNRVRHSLGYQYCGYPAHLLLFMTLMWFCLRKKAYLVEAALFLAANYIMYVMTDSRTDFYLTVFGIIGFFVWEKTFHNKSIRIFRDLITEYGFILLAFSSIAAHIFYDPANAWMQRINQLLNGRLGLGYNAIHEYGFSLFGREIRWYGQGSLRVNPDLIYNYVDCSFLKEALTYGLIFLLLLAAGYYLLGKYVVENEQHRLGWAILMSLAYSVINAHLCVLTFNVFILALGTLFSKDAFSLTGKSSEENVDTNQREKNRLDMHNYLKTQIGKIVSAIGACQGLVSHKESKKKENRYLNEQRKHTLRTLLFLGILGYATLIQLQGSKYIINYAAMHMWLICGALLVLAVLCYEGRSWKSFAGDKLLWVVVSFLMLSCISDFFVSKKFIYSAFGLLVFGGLFCRVWCNMVYPEQLIEEFKRAYKIWFAAVLLYCVAARPAIPGICYTGVFLNANNFSISMIIAFVLFLSDFYNLKNSQINDRHFLEGYFKKTIINGAGAAVTLYFVWISQRVTCILIAGLIAGIYMVFWLFVYLRTDTMIRTKSIPAMLCAVGVGILVVFLLRYLLYNVSPILGIQVVFKGEQKEKIEETVLSSLVNGSWLDIMRMKLWCCKEYLKETNFLGHKYLAKIAGKTRWPENSISINMFRYGLIAGTAYTVMLILYLWRAIVLTVRKGDFFPAGLALASITVGMIEVIEMPFVQIGWLVFYFGLGWMLVLGRKEKRDEISQYKY